MSSPLRSISRRAAIKAIETGALMSVAYTEGCSARYVVAIDPASDVEDHYVEAVFRIDEKRVTCVSMTRYPNSNALIQVP